MFFNLLRKQLIRASGLSPISIWYPWKIKEDFFFFFYWSDDFTFYVCWKWSRGKGPLKSLGWKVSKQVCYKEKVPHSFSAKHTHTYIEMQTASWWHASRNLADTHRTYACVHTPTTAKTHTPRNYRENSCSLTSRCCRDDWGEEKCRSKESREREDRGGKDGGADLLVACCLLNRVWTKSPLRITLRGNLSQIQLDLDGTYPVLLKKTKTAFLLILVPKKFWHRCFSFSANRIVCVSQLRD